MTKRFLLTVLLSKFFQRAYSLNVQGRKLDFHRIFLHYFPSKIFSIIFFQFLLGLTNASCPREIEKMLIQNFGGITKSIMVFWENRTDFGEDRRDRGPPFLFEIFIISIQFSEKERVNM